MMTKKTAAEVKAQVAQMLSRLPDGWLEREKTAAKSDPNRDLKTLEMICAALEDQVKQPRPKKRSPIARGLPLFDLHHHDTDENAEWSAVQSLMDRIEAGAEGKPEFEIWEPGEGPKIVDVALAAMGEASAWILESKKKGTSYFLARGNGPEYYECILRGCPEFVRDCCLLSRAEAELAVTALIQREQLQPDWHWIPVTQVLERLGR